ncbi:MAG: lipoprotein-releasing system ATP-binding protein LolD [Bdellovibrio sp. CG10_big_fil_rev_8_21_14_0_10_47_8]|nr:MAG: lipoprotein-releasing system ATP-binding protein LolD [Bdellovibrio sp. CG10_big_fil_rev_8_21_14_0_10_47_8]
MSSGTSPILSAKRISKSYPQGAGHLDILKEISLDIHHGEAICIVGASGAGKSTLLHILGTLDRPNSGELSFGGRSLLSMADEDLSLFRNQEMGFVFQFHHLLTEFTALENVLIPLRVRGVSKSESEDRAAEILNTLGLGERFEHFPSQLSGGELQRVAIARALIGRPQILFADEPTGNLDSHNSAVIQDLFFQLKESFGLTLVVVTHDPQFSRKFPRVLKMSDGRWV